MCPARSFYHKLCFLRTKLFGFVLKIEGTSSCGKDWRGSGAVPERSAGMKAEAATPESLFFAQIRCDGDGQKAAQNEKMAENQNSASSSTGHIAKIRIID